MLCPCRFKLGTTSSLPSTKTDYFKTYLHIIELNNILKLRKTCSSSLDISSILIISRMQHQLTFIQKLPITILIQFYTNLFLYNLINIINEIIGTTTCFQEYVGIRALFKVIFHASYISTHGQFIL